MCFSATASFGSGAALFVAGIITIKKAEKPAQLAFAAIPLLFSLQQLSEGFVWLSLTNASFGPLQTFAVRAFLFFAHMLWPSWIALSVLLMERNFFRRKILCSIISIGLTLSLSEVYCAWAYPLAVSIKGHHVEYNIDFPPLFNTISSVLYGIVTFMPCFISTQKKVWVFGITLVSSFIISRVFYAEYVISVWCFFAALLSAVIYFILPVGEKGLTIKNILARS